jgi:hypothetical protein
VSQRDTEHISTSPPEHRVARGDSARSPRDYLISYGYYAGVIPGQRTRGGDEEVKGVKSRKVEKREEV